ncbi:Bug family tripartite tricarboxylate transporter substrate binding protein [Bordetella petrii]|uniref:Bug family tripartite tricarboxylate transporter substrate binding protein n=1 Tax=Bordetella petrii TaxID=94624 RepID=UPI001E5051C1|nr:tripartite tricarboxylate transporter substrate binding protein [Bordetella petrii]MCD0502898.1 tripartite tricarboxylate transporter substrate binding protein [Bordetella petrii]
MRNDRHACPDTQRRKALGLLGAGALAAAMPWSRGLAAAQGWPQRPISYIVPFSPGGLTDVAARQVSQALSTGEGWNVVVENKPGGSANIGATLVARADPDGYSWLAITMTHAANATLFAGKAGYDLKKDLVPLAGLASSAMMVVVNAKSPIRSLDDLTRAAKAGSLSAGSSGNGTPPHLTLALYQKLTGTNLLHVPYKGGAPSLTDLLGGQLDVIFSNYPESLPHVKSGALRALAVSTAERSPDLPDVPTVAEAGLPDLVVENFTGVLAPAGMPQDLVLRIGGAIEKQVSQPAMQQALQRLGFVPRPRGPVAFKQYLDSEVDRWGAIIREARIQVG